MVPHLEDKEDLVLEAAEEETVVLEHNLDLVEEHLAEVMEHLQHLVAQAAAEVAVELYQEILEQVEEQQHQVDLVEMDNQEQYMFILELRHLL
jgi:phytoene/squalene synthetase